MVLYEDTKTKNKTYNVWTTYVENYSNNKDKENHKEMQNLTYKFEDLILLEIRFSPNWFIALT